MKAKKATTYRLMFLLFWLVGIAAGYLISSAETNWLIQARGLNAVSAIIETMISILCVFSLPAVISTSRKGSHMMSFTTGTLIGIWLYSTYLLSFGSMFVLLIILALPLNVLHFKLSWKLPELEQLLEDVKNRN